MRMGIFTSWKHPLNPADGRYSLLKQTNGGPRNMKKAIIEVQLIKEAAETPNEELEKEILQELSEELPKIPWQGKIKKVRVVES
jgi:hypothetical protein